MVKLYEFCKIYHLSIEVEYSKFNDGITFTFYNREANKMCKIGASQYEMGIYRSTEMLEDSIYRKAIDTLGLDKTLWEKE